MRRASDKDVTKTMAQVAKGLRDPLNFLDLRLTRNAVDRRTGEGARWYCC